MTTRLMYAAAVVAIMVTATASPGQDPAGQLISTATVPQWAARTADGLYELSFEGRTLHRTTHLVRNERLVAVPGSSAIAAVWDEVNAAQQTTPHCAVRLDGQSWSRVRATGYVIRLRYRNFDPLVEGPPAVPLALAAPAGSRLHLVQFVVPPLEPMRGQIEALGGEVVRFMADHTHVVRMDAAAAEQVAQLPYVRWVGPFHTAYKVDDEILQHVTAGFPESGPQRYSIEAFLRGPAEQDAVKARVEATGGQVYFTTPLGYRMEASLTPEQMLAVAGMDEVHVLHAIHYDESFEDMDIVREIGGGNYIETLEGFSGQGVRGESLDSGCQINHQDFTPTPIWRTTAATGSHGTASYGCMFATGFGNAAARGMCSSVEQGFVQYTGAVTQFGGPVTRHSLYQAAVNPAGTVRVVMNTCSNGPYRTRVYDSISAETDDYLFLYGLLSTQSMSNAGGTPDVRPMAWAKNIVGVGGVTHRNTISRADDIASGSSGESQDGRIKPDLCHFYDNVLTTYSTSTTGYGQFSGTSSATPITAGHFGLLFQMWHEGVWAGRGGQASVFDSRAKMATAKALMINNAYHYPLTQGDLRRHRQGWGMADLRRAYDMADKTFIVDEDDVLVPLGTNTYQVNVEAGEPELRVTMVYTDLMGPTSATQHRINDLSLRVTSPGNVSYWGNNGLVASHFNTPGGVSNTKDTVENVFIENPQAGTWTIEVIGDEIIQDAHVETPALDADYALIASGVTIGGSGGPGDMNCDGVVDSGDAGPFALAAVDPAAYAAAFPACNILNGDLNEDGTLDGLDFGPFIAVLLP